MSTSDYRRRPDPSEHADFYNQFLDLVTEDDILAALENQIEEFRSLLSPISEEVAGIVHPPYTWTIRQVIGHCIDNERVFGDRVARFASADKTDLPGYDQDAYVANMDYERCSLATLVSELEFVRLANLSFLTRIAPECWDRRGTADGKSNSVRAIAYLFVGHLRHHLLIIEQRLKDAAA